MELRHLVCDGEFTAFVHVDPAHRDLQVQSYTLASIKKGLALLIVLNPDRSYAQLDFR